MGGLGWKVLVNSELVVTADETDPSVVTTGGVMSSRCHGWGVGRWGKLSKPVGDTSPADRVEAGSREGMLGVVVEGRLSSLGKFERIFLRPPSPPPQSGGSSTHPQPPPYVRRDSPSLCVRVTHRGAQESAAHHDARTRLKRKSDRCGRVKRAKRLCFLPRFIPFFLSSDKRDSQGWW